MKHQLLILLIVWSVSIHTIGQVFLYNTDANEVYLGCINRMKILYNNSPNGFVVQGDEAIIFKEYDEWIIAPNYSLFKPFLTIHLIGDSTGDTLISYKLKPRPIPTPTFYWGNREEKNNGFLFNVTFSARLPMWFPYTYNVEITTIYVNIHKKRYEISGNRLSPEIIARLRTIPKGEAVTIAFQYKIKDAYFTYQTYWIIN